MTDSYPVPPVTRRVFWLTGLAGLLRLWFRYGQPLLGWLIDALRAGCVDSWSVRLFGALLSFASERLIASST